ncbi:MULTISPECIES: metal ABC transporter ATP-binding protein [Sporosarcina]|uniref:metal ABC transporter ATP-binding protein n=1 Tax=Sporosarcina TaxID=1569 RepID=UPI00058EC9EC|nr:MULTISPECIES: metal ABC transporter ATP-binding protein [Sporosarcina]WJY27566.1 metal ABC transporter ATP-binding protein [Sporosarcina sp. 0.2-SM1T-5]
MSTAAIGLQHVTFGYTSEPVMDNLSFSIPSGQFTVITGENGAAKTTALKLLGGLLVPWSGSRFGMRQSAVSYLPQDAAAIEPDFPSTVREFVLSGVWDRKKWFQRIRKEDKAKAAEMIGQFGLSELADRPIGRLSGGQRQKACTARAFMAAPSILLLDEPTSGMDEKTRKQFYQVLKAMTPAVTIVMITHHLDELQPYLDRILQMEEGTCICSN